MPQEIELQPMVTPEGPITYAGARPIITICSRVARKRSRSASRQAVYNGRVLHPPRPLFQVIHAWRGLHTQRNSWSVSGAGESADIRRSAGIGGLERLDGRLERVMVRLKLMAAVLADGCVGTALRQSRLCV